MDSAEVTEIKRHFNVVAERLEGRIQQLAEGLVGLDERLVCFEERVEGRFDAMDRRLEET